MSTILLAEDENALRELVRTTLGTEHRLLEASNGREALEIARRERPDLVLLDVMMPEVNGFEVCRQLKRDPATRDTVVVMLTALAGDDERRLGLEAGADHYLTKPFRPSALLATVQQSLRGPREPAAPPSGEARPVTPTAFDQTLAYARDVSQLYNAARKRAARLRLLVEMGQELVATPGLDTLLRLALERATGFSGYEAGSVLLLNGPDGPLEVRAAIGAEVPALGSHVEDLATSIAGRAMTERQPIVVAGPGEEIGTEWRKDTKPIPSSISLPLLSPEGGAIGVLVLKNPAAVRHLDADDLEALQLLAALLGAAVYSSQLRERLERNLAELLALHEAGQVLGASLELEAVGRRLLESAQHVSRCEAAVLSLHDGRGCLRVWQALGPEGLWRAARRSRAAQAAQRAAVASGTPRTIRLRAPEVAEGTRAGWCLPLRVHDRTIGTLTIYGPEAMMAGVSVEILGSLASQAASALENARLYRELADREARLQDLVGRLLMAQEEERRRVAYDVHDGLAQVAASTHQHLQAFAHRHRPRSPAARAALDQALDLARRTVGEARRVIADLRPTALDDFGLATAIRLQVEALRREGWEISYREALPGGRLPPTVETALYRVVQEALTNVRKHAGTTRVHVELRRQGDLLQLEVQDWGHGFRPAVADGRSGPGERVGLPGMRERIALLGGRFHVRSRPGAGTRVTVQLPITNLAPREGTP